VRVAVLDEPCAVAVNVEEVAAATGEVCTVKVAEDDPAGMVADAGTVTEATLLLSAIDIPPVGAVPVIDTLPVEFVPPVTDDGLTLSEASALPAKAYRLESFEPAYSDPSAAMAKELVTESPV